MNKVPDSPQNGNGRCRVLIADDHAVFAQGLKALLERSFEVIGIVSDGRALLETAARLQPDVVIVDIGMPVLNGLDSARRIREHAPDMKLVFLTMRDDPNLAAAALELGCAGYVLKHSAFDEVAVAIDRVLQNKCYLTPKLRSQDWVEAKSRAHQFSKELTPRQRDVVQLYAEGYSIKQIASQLNLSQKTIEFHKHHIMHAFNLRSNAGLILFAIQHGLVSLPPEAKREAKAS
jgi:DNA-binding NarL/FixJ family response regulator